MNAMALIAPGAFLWLTFQIQALYGAPLAGQSMWFGILAALLLCFATAYSYAELSKIYPGAGSSYLYAEQAFIGKTKAFKFARIAKFFTGWASHLYYWVYPGCMVGVTAILSGYLLNQFFPDTFSGQLQQPAVHDPLLRRVCARRGLHRLSRRDGHDRGQYRHQRHPDHRAARLHRSSRSAYRLQHKQDSVGWHLSNGTAVHYQVDTTNVLDDKGKPVQDAWADTPPTPKVDDKGQPVFKTAGSRGDQGGPGQQGRPAARELRRGRPLSRLAEGSRRQTRPDKDGKAIPVPFTVSYKPEDAVTGQDGDAKDPQTFNFHTTAASVVAPHSLQLHLHPGLYRHSHPGRVRVGHGDG